MKKHLLLLVGCAWCLFSIKKIMLNLHEWECGRSRSTWREPLTMGKQLVNFITCGCESSAPLFVIYKAGREPTPYWWSACMSIIQLPNSLPADVHLKFINFPWQYNMYEKTSFTFSGLCLMLVFNKKDYVKFTWMGVFIYDFILHSKLHQYYIPI
jgi:hypothetical protein